MCAFSEETLVHTVSQRAQVTRLTGKDSRKKDTSCSVLQLHQDIVSYDI